MTDLGEALLDVDVALRRVMTVIDPEYVRTKRAEAADEACATVQLAMGLGLMDDVPLNNRAFIAKPLMVWSCWNDAMKS